ncbi:glutamyl aminopeptidase-like [Harpegnathos saltator]|nr:glutamyl aminopeptidase-like [Harpegnathos saltator]
MIERMTTWNKFQLAVTEYFDKFKFRSATPSNLWITLQRRLDSTNQMVGINEIMDTWLSQSTM